jgi:TolB-like protein
MKKLTSVLCLVAAAVAVAPSGARAQRDTLPTLAVMPFDNNFLGANAADYAALGGGVADLMRGTLLRNPGLRVIERTQLDALMKEQDLGASGRVDAATAARLGRILGAKHMIMGDITTDMDPRTRMPNTVTVHVRAVNVETSEIISLGDRIRGRPDQLMELLEQATERASANLRLPSIPAGPAREAANTARRTNEKVPFQTVLLYSRALEAEDKGNRSEAINLYTQAQEKFPDHEPSKQALRRLQSGG